MPVAKEKGGDFKQADAGTCMGRCFAVIALGVQESPNYPASNKVMLMFEIPEQVMEIEGEQVPMTIKSEYTLSLNSKAKLRKHLESWRGRPFTKEELDGFDVAKVVGQPALLTVVHKTGGTGKTYANIESIAKTMKGMVCPPQHHGSVIYEIEHGRNETFRKLPDWIQKSIEKCEEWKTPAQKTESAPSSAAGAPTIDDDTVPF